MVSIILILLAAPALGLTRPTAPAQQRAVVNVQRRFVLTTIPAAAVALTTTAASARGRGTQGAMAQRYYPRIVKFGQYIVTDLVQLAAAGDFVALEAACRAEVATKKGVVGPLYGGESAMSLWAASYSEIKVSQKSRDMQAQVDIIASCREAIAKAAGQGTGTIVASSGGLFGFGSKVEPPPPKAELIKTLKAAAATAKVAYNEYCVLNNVGLPMEINTLNPV
ncbi:hypothetical protein M885DRAFT_522890 [Pelagophyceae sp. CCMP2097]|nr:hypothetical protein M885DRAFT_522890 [Pelagophyceae sp. CCMP2097]